MNAEDKIGLEQVATAFRQSAYNAWSNVLIGSAPPKIKEAFQRMKNPQIGDWVIETTTIRGFRHAPASDLDGIGILEEISHEPVVFNAPDFVWNEEEEERPHPTERVYYIRTLDGRRFRWSNANIVVALTDLQS